HGAPVPGQAADVGADGAQVEPRELGQPEVGGVLLEHDRRQRLAAQVVVGVAEHLDQSGVDVGDGPVQAQARHAYSSAGEHGAEVTLRLFEGGLGAAAVG